MDDGYDSVVAAESRTAYNAHGECCALQKGSEEDRHPHSITVATNGHGSSTTASITALQRESDSVPEGQLESPWSQGRSLLLWLSNWESLLVPLQRMLS